jgi:hypothetical protein
VFILTGVAPLATAETTYLGLYLQGTKIGYSSYAAAPAKIDGKAATRSDSRTVMNVGLLGQAMTMNMDSTTWTTPSGAPLRLKFRMSSSGRVQTVDAVFNRSQIVATIENAGRRSTKTLKVPAGQTLVDDPLAGVIAGQIKPGATRTFYVLDPSTVDLVKNDVRVVGKRKAKVGTKSVDATLVEIVDPRATMRVYLSGKGDLVRVDGPMGIEMLPVSRKVALGGDGGYTPSVDLAFATSLKTDKPITEPTKLTGLKLRVTGRDLARLPSDTHQTVSREGDAWVVDVHPVRLDEVKSVSIAEAARQKPEWVKPSLYLPSDAERMRALAKKIVGDRTDVKSAALAIRSYVHEQMRPNAGIGVLRDAREVLDTKEGVCRDYAILTTTLLRAAGIPARLSSGLVNWDGSFFYHAWAEAWTGDRWIGLDSTAEPEQITPTHVKLGEGSVETAFTFTFLDKVKIELLEARRD